MNKCLCPCPDYIQWEDEAGTHTQLLKGFGTVLHGRKATRGCCKCKTGLCPDCLTVIKHGGYSWYYCPDCAGEVTG